MSARLVHVEPNSIKTLYVSKKDRIPSSSTSKGNQIKWLKDGKYIKLNSWKFYEDISEVLVSHLLRYSNVGNYVEYFSCNIVEDGVLKGTGCYSFDFLGKGESDISFYRLLKNNGISLEEMSFDSLREDLFYIVGFDVKEYLDKCFCIDTIDRHLNNLSIIKTNKGYKFAPIYDNGLSCLSDIFSYPIDVNLEDNLSRVKPSLFSTDFVKILLNSRCKPIKIDYNGFLSSVSLETEEEKRALNVIKRGLERSKGIAWEDY